MRDLLVTMVSCSLLSSSVGCGSAEPPTSADMNLGEEVTLEESAFLVSVMMRSGASCRGAILSPEWVVTLQSCLNYPAQDLDIFSLAIGLEPLEWVGDNRDGPTLYPIDDVIMAPGYLPKDRKDEDRAENNLALVHLAKPLEYGPKIQPIRVATAADEAAGLTKPGTVGQLVGYETNTVVSEPNRIIKAAVRLTESEKPWELSEMGDISGTSGLDLGGTPVTVKDAKGERVLVGLVISADRFRDNPLPIYRLSTLEPWLTSFLPRSTTKIETKPEGSETTSSGTTSTVTFTLDQPAAVLSVRAWSEELRKKGGEKLPLLQLRSVDGEPIGTEYHCSLPPRAPSDDSPYTGNPPSLLMYYAHCWVYDPKPGQWVLDLASSLPDDKFRISVVATR